MSIIVSPANVSIRKSPTQTGVDKQRIAAGPGGCQGPVDDRRLEPPSRAGGGDVFRDALEELRDRFIPVPRAPDRWRPRRYEDASAGRAIDELRAQPLPISGDALERAILKGTADLDGNAAGGEYRDLKRYVAQSWDKLSPDAKAKWRVYEQTALRCQAEGKRGIPAADYAHMAEQMRGTDGRQDGSYRDASAREALSALENEPGTISAGDFMKAFSAGTGDLDGQAFGRELEDFARFADKNWDRMTPGARAAFLAYQHVAQHAQLHGRDGASALEHGALTRLMKQASAWADQCSILQVPIRI